MGLETKFYIGKNERYYPTRNHKDEDVLNIAKVCIDSEDIRELTTDEVIYLKNLLNEIKYFETKYNNDGRDITKYGYKTLSKLDEYIRDKNKYVEMSLYKNQRLINILYKKYKHELHESTEIKLRQIMEISKELEDEMIKTSDINVIKQISSYYDMFRTFVDKALEYGYKYEDVIYVYTD